MGHQVQADETRQGYGEEVSEGMSNKAILNGALGFCFLCVALSFLIVRVRQREQLEYLDLQIEAAQTAERTWRHLTNSMRAGQHLPIGITPKKPGLHLPEAGTEDLYISNCICIGLNACATKSHQLVITWEDGTELRLDLPTNTWIRGWWKP